MKAKTETTTASLAVVGVDIGKEVLHLVGLNTDGTIALRRKIRRFSLKDVFEQLPPCVVGMEACLSAHFVSRTLRALGREPRIIPAIYTKPFVKGQKNDYNDAEAVAEAALRPDLRVVQERAKTSSTYRHVIVSHSDWCPDGRRRSTRSEPFRSNKASASGPEHAPYAIRARHQSILWIVSLLLGLSQWKTARLPAVISLFRFRTSEEFRGIRPLSRCSFSGKIAKTAAPVRGARIEIPGPAPTAVPG